LGHLESTNEMIDISFVPPHSQISCWVIGLKTLVIAGRDVDVRNQSQSG
jgi:hypothetical protein